MMTISKSKLKAQMLQILREIEKSGEELIVTNHGRPVLRIQAIGRKRSVEEVFGALQGQVIYNEDINASTLDEWGEA